MLLKDYIYNLEKKYQRISFSGISCDSSKIKKNNIFFAIKGNRFDGNKFINNAIKKGAKIIVSESKIQKNNKDVIFLHSDNVRKLLAEIAYKILGNVAKKLVAVTGTNGKSSIADFYFQILNLNYKSVASIGTLGMNLKKKKKYLSNTTLDPIQLSSILKILKKKKVNNIIMEASSHGLKQNRLDGLLFDIGVFTNLSHDHLDYHNNMKDYLNSKLYLFERLIKKGGYIISDAKIPQIKKIKKIAYQKKINLNLIFDKNRGIELISHHFEKEKQILVIKFDKKLYKFNLNLIGKIQIKNVLMAILAAHKSGLKFNKIVNIIHKIKPVSGRLEKVGKIKNLSKVILDYAHTPAALESALLNLKEQFPNKNISLVFGCGGERDQKKRLKMGKIASKYSDKIFLTDDNPRNENPSQIRKDIKNGIKRKKIREIPNRKKAICEAITKLKTGDVLLVAGKGHEKFQDYGKKKIFFSDKDEILNSIEDKNNSLNKDLRLNIIREESKSHFSQKLVIREICINSKKIKKNDIFFAIKGKRLDGNKFVSEAFKKKASLAIVNKLRDNYNFSRQVKVKNTLNFLTKSSFILRENINSKIIAITGSCGKTTLKDMIGQTLGKLSKTFFSPKSFNNKYGVPVSLFNLKEKDKYGVFEVGMDKKGEINHLTKIIKPDLGIITNISYAHSKNFENIKKIAEAKAEIMNNIEKGGTIILNRDDNFYNFHKNYALNKKLKVVSFGIKEKLSTVKLISTKKIKNIFKIKIKIENSKIDFYSNNINDSHLYNILATLTLINLFEDITKLKKDVFLNFKVPQGRGDISKINIQNKKIFLVDETYNSNPLSLKSAIANYDKIDSKNSKKYLVLGDMLELGKHSIKQHRLISKILNRTRIDKVYVLGNFIKETFKALKSNKKARILNNKSDIIELINKDLDNNDYLMIKGSNATGLHKLITNLKQRVYNAI